MLKIVKDFSLKELNTFKIDAYSNYFVEIGFESQIDELINTEIFRNEKRFILGGGSNILFVKDFDGLVISMNIKGIEFEKLNEDDYIIKAGAGEYWSDLVEFCIKQGLNGIENLALIPGKVGAAPVQNIGAYGIEQSDIFYSLTGFDLTDKKMKTFFKDDCKFNYRDSIFKNELKDKIIITSVSNKLTKTPKFNISYKELQKIIENSNEEINSKLIFNSVCNLRKSKLPDYKILGNAGSFFKNPIIDEKQFNFISKKNYNFLPYKISETAFKASAGWLIENTGLKGFRKGNIGTYEKHALVLINYGGATGKEIYNFSEFVKQKVKDEFEIELMNEVQLIF